MPPHALLGPRSATRRRAVRCSPRWRSLRSASPFGSPIGCRARKRRALTGVTGSPYPSRMTERTKVAAVQMTSTEDVAAQPRDCHALDARGGRRRRGAGGAARVLRAARARGAQAGGGRDAAGGRPDPGALRATRARTVVELVLGGFWERGSDPEQGAQRLRAPRPRRRVRAVYRKIHLFDVDLPDGSTLRESADGRAGHRAGRHRHALRQARAVGLLRPALPRAVPRAGRSGRDRAHGAGGVHADDRQGPLARAAARARDRGAVLRDRRGAERAPLRHARLVRPRADLRSVGHGRSSECGEGEGYAIASDRSRGGRARARGGAEPEAPALG